MCIKHFPEEQILRVIKVTRPDGSELVFPWKKLNLSQDAVPSIFPDLPQSTYICEMTFRKIKFIKGTHRSRLTNVNLENLLRICVADQPALIDKIVEESSRVRSSTSQQ
ncbi:hypothetical protein C0J52_14687 [Blattella germanica]|nr:hypothetical protein C0J52_14687 [Blattella germanica]